MSLALPENASQAALASSYWALMPVWAVLYWSFVMACAMAPTLNTRPLVKASARAVSSFMACGLAQLITPRHTVDDAHAVTHANIVEGGLRDRLVGAVLHADVELVGVGLRLVALFQLVTGVGTTCGAKHGRGGVALAATDLVAQDAAHNAAHHGTCADTAAALLHQFDRLHHAIAGVGTIVGLRVASPGIAVVGRGHGVATAERQ